MVHNEYTIPVFDFRLLPIDEHAYLVYHGLWEIFFDLALYPCDVEMIAGGPGFMMTKVVSAEGPEDALDAWEDVQDQVSGRLSSWLSVEVSRLKRTPHRPPVSGLGCYEEMLLLERTFTVEQ